MGLALNRAFCGRSSGHVTSVAQSACLHDIKGIRAVKLSIEFVAVPSPIDTIFDFGEPFSQIRAIGLLPFGQHPRLTAVEQDWVDQGLVNGEFCLA
jgi:hypothetical protein